MVITSITSSTATCIILMVITVTIMVPLKLSEKANGIGIFRWLRAGFAEAELQYNMAFFGALIGTTL